MLVHKETSTRCIDDVFEDAQPSLTRGPQSMGDDGSLKVFYDKYVLPRSDSRLGYWERSNITLDLANSLTTGTVHYLMKYLLDETYKSMPANEKHYCTPYQK